MKAITLWQPWASMVALGYKTIETRSWSTSYRGPLAIHAALRTPPRAQRECVDNPRMSDLLRRNGLRWDALPTGVIVATVYLAYVWHVEQLSGCIGSDEAMLGDFTPGRFAWKLTNLYALPEPIPARGHQRLWEWTEPV